jgi:hypothetical protein
MPPLLNMFSRHSAELIKDRDNFNFSLFKDAVNIETVVSIRLLMNIEQVVE